MPPPPPPYSTCSYDDPFRLPITTAHNLPYNKSIEGLALTLREQRYLHIASAKTLHDKRLSSNA